MHAHARQHAYLFHIFVLLTHVCMAISARAVFEHADVIFKCKLALRGIHAVPNYTYGIDGANSDAAASLG